MYLISAYFDEQTNRILQGYIDAVAAATGNDFMTAHRVPPHMTIGAVEARSQDVLMPSFMEFLGEVDSGPVEFVSIGQLMPQVIYAQPYLNEYLMDLSVKSYESFKDIPETSISSRYQPYQWLPHVTLGKTLTKEQLLKAVEATCDFAPFTGRITSMGIARVNAGFDERYELTSN